MIYVWMFLFLVSSISYGVKSESTFLSLVSTVVLLMGVLSFLWSDASIFKIGSIKSIAISISLSFIGAALLLYNKLISGLITLLEWGTINMFDIFWLNFVFTTLFLLSTLKLMKNLKRQYLTVILVALGLNVYAKDISLVEKLTNIEIISGTHTVEKNKTSYQIKTFPFMCRPLGHQLPSTFVSLIYQENELYVGMKMLSIQDIPPVCLKKINEEIGKLLEHEIVVDHNLEDAIEGKATFFISMKFPEKTITKESIKALFHKTSSNLRMYKALAGIMLLLAMIIYLHNFKILRRKD